MLDVTAEHHDSEADAPLGHSAMIEAPSVFLAAGAFTPWAMMAEARMFWRKSLGLAHRWSSDLAKCRTASEAIEVNAKYGEKAMALGYSECWRVAERSALLGRRAVAPESLKLRDADED